VNASFDLLIYANTKSAPVRKGRVRSWFHPNSIRHPRILTRSVTGTPGEVYSQGDALISRSQLQGGKSLQVAEEDLSLCPLSLDGTS